MKKVCHVTSAHPPEDGRIFRRACVAAALAGYETVLVERGDSYTKQGVRIVGIGEPAKPGRRYRMTTFAKKAYQAALAEDADLYHLHDPELLRFARKLKKRGKAVVFDSHENYIEQIRNKSYLPGPAAKAVSKYYGKYIKRIFAEIDGLTYPGSSDEPSPFDRLCKRVAPTDNLPWLSELYDLYDGQAEREPNTACYAGGLTPSRGITQIVKAADKAGCKLYLAGRFSSDAYREKLEAMEEYRCVEYLGVLPHEEIASLLARVQVGLCVLRNVGQYHKMTNLPTKIYEYMSMGLPVIANSSAYNDRIISALGIGVCVDAEDTEALSEAMRTLCGDRERCRQMGENGRRAVKETYCWDKEKENLLEMYRSILGE